MVKVVELMTLTLVVVELCILHCRSYVFQSDLPNVSSLMHGIPMRGEIQISQLGREGFDANFQQSTFDLHVARHLVSSCDRTMMQAIESEFDHLNF